jgi:hypothetical protein
MILPKAKKRIHCWCACAAKVKEQDVKVKFGLSVFLSFARIVKAGGVPG